MKRIKVAVRTYLVTDEVSMTVYHLLKATEHERKLLFGQLLLLLGLQNRYIYRLHVITDECRCFRRKHITLPSILYCIILLHQIMCYSVWTFYHLYMDVLQCMDVLPFPRRCPDSTLRQLVAGPQHSPPPCRTAPAPSRQRPTYLRRVRMQTFIRQLINIYTVEHHRKLD